MNKKAKKDSTTEVDEKEVDVEETEEETDEVDSEESETEDESSSNEDSPDYEALLKEERERAEKAEKALAEAAFKDRKKKRQEPDGDENESESDDEDDKPLTIKDLRAHEARIIARTQKQMQDSRALEIARAHTSSEEEAKAAHLFWKNRVVPTDNLEADVLFAIGGLNHRKIVGKNQELARALRSRETTVDDTSGTQRESQLPTSVKVKGDLHASLKRAGFELDTKRKLWIKEVSKGNFVYKDLKTGRIQPLKIQ